MAIVNSDEWFGKVTDTGMPVGVVCPAVPVTAMNDHLTHFNQSEICVLMVLSGTSNL